MRPRPKDALRIGFGVIWLIDAILKWLPGLKDGYMGHHHGYPRRPAVLAALVVRLLDQPPAPGDHLLLGAGRHDQDPHRAGAHLRVHPQGHLPRGHHLQRADLVDRRRVWRPVHLRCLRYRHRHHLHRRVRRAVARHRADHRPRPRRRGHRLLTRSGPRRDRRALHLTEVNGLVHMLARPIAVSQASRVRRKVAASWLPGRLTMLRLSPNKMGPYLGGPLGRYYASVLVAPGMLADWIGRQEDDSGEATLIWRAIAAGPMAVRGAD